MSKATIEGLIGLLSRLKKAKIHYTLSNPTEGAVMIEVAVPGERWEIEFHSSGEIGIEVFKSGGSIGGAELLPGLFERFSGS